MKTPRFQLLLTVMVSLILAGVGTDSLKAKIPESVKKQYGMNAVPCSSEQASFSKSADGINARFSKRTTEYLAVNIGLGSKKYEMIDSSTKEVEGVSTFTGDYIKTNKFVVYDRIRIMHGHAAAGTDILDVEFTSVLPKEWESATLVIESSEKKVVELPLSSINAEQNASLHGFLELADPAYFADGKQFQITLKQPKQFAGTDDNYFKILLDGVKTVA